MKQEQGDFSLDTGGIGYCRTCYKRGTKLCPFPKVASRYNGDCVQWDDGRKATEEAEQAAAEVHAAIERIKK